MTSASPKLVGAQERALGEAAVLLALGVVVAAFMILLIAKVARTRDKRESVVVVVSLTFSDERESVF